MDRLFSEIMGERPQETEERPAYPFPLDMYGTETARVEMAARSGLRPDDEQSAVKGDTLIIKGETKQEEKIDRGNFLRRELRYGMYSRAIPLPVAVDTDKAEAIFEHGILTVRLPKTAEAKARTIKVKAK